MQEQPHNTPRLIGNIYRVGQVMATNSMLTTYTAYNRNTNDVVGLSVLRRPTTITPQQAQQLLQPLEKYRALQSPHVIRVYNWGLDDELIYIVTDPPRGVTLQYVLDNENISTSRAFNLIQQLTSGLQMLHAQEIIGLDLRPQLVTVDTVGIIDRVQIDDIGLRQLLYSLGYQSQQQNRDVGFFDPRFAPPEYINNHSAGVRSDIYLLGLLLFNLITGRLPFIGRTAAETGVMQSTSPLPRMSGFKHDTPRVVQELVERLLAKNPQQRPASTDALQAELQTILAEIQPQSSPTTPHLAALKDKDTKPQPPNIAGTVEMASLKLDTTLQQTLTAAQHASTSAITQQIPVPDAQGVYAYLCYTPAHAETQRIAIRQKNTIIGRTDPKRGVTPDLDLTEFDPRMTVSRLHARIRFEETFFYIEDLKSRNKTRLGSLILSPLKAELLQHGDSLFFGSVRLYFEIPGMPKNASIKNERKNLEG